MIKFPHLRMVIGRVKIVQSSENVFILFDGVEKVAEFSSFQSARNYFRKEFKWMRSS